MTEPISASVYRDSGVVRPPRRGPFYGWLLAIVGAAIMAIGAASFSHPEGGSVWTSPIEHELQFSWTVISWAGLLAVLVGVVMAPIAGYGADKAGPRRMALIGFALLAVGFLTFSWTANPWMFYLAFALAGLGTTLGAGIPVYTALNNWFRRRRSLAMSIPTLGLVLGSIITTPLVAHGMSFLYWRHTALLMSAIVLVAAVPCALLVRNRPEDYGQRPYGSPAEPAGTPAPDYSWREALSSRAFWLMALGEGFINFGSAAISFSLVSWPRDEFSLVFVPWAIGLMSLFQLLFIVVGGILGDRERIPLRRMIFAFALLALIGLVGLLFVRTPPLIYLSVGLIGAGMGGMAPLWIVLRSVYFGRRNFGTILGIGLSARDLARFLTPSSLGLAAVFVGPAGSLYLATAAAAAGALLLALLPAPSLSPSQRRSAEPLLPTRQGTSGD